MIYCRKIINLYLHPRLSLLFKLTHLLAIRPSHNTLPYMHMCNARKSAPVAFPVAFYLRKTRILEKKRAGGAGLEPQHNTLHPLGSWGRSVGRQKKVDLGGLCGARR